jgi:hypothetical protein
MIRRARDGVGPTERGACRDDVRLRSRGGALCQKA